MAGRPVVPLTRKPGDSIIGSTPIGDRGISGQLNQSVHREIVSVRRRQERSVETRDKLISAATVEFAEHGYAGASTRDVAQRANVPHTLVTYHFKNKDGLWRAVATALNERFRQRYQERLHGLRGVDEGTRLRLIVEDFIRFSAENPDFHWIMSYEAAKGGPRLDWLVEHFVSDFFEALRPLVKAAQKRGQFIEGDPDYLIYLIVSLGSRIFMLDAEVQKVTGTSPQSRAFIDRHIRTCLSLLFPAMDPGSSESPRASTRSRSATKAASRPPRR